MVLGWIAGILILLILGSVLSWVIIFRKNRVYSRATDEADDFEGRFWSGVDLTQLYRSATDRNRVVSGLEAIFEAGFTTKSHGWGLGLSLARRIVEPEQRDVGPDLLDERVRVLVSSRKDLLSRRSPCDSIITC